MSDKLDLILERLDRIETEQKQQGDILIQLIGTVKATNEKVSDIKDAVSSLAKIQEKQDKILESLALRSLEQESEIREIKRIK
ncbi:hypothetical protein [Effusibacillus lacus]|uniref:Uncharacterized protein n=1 Tax=Effusibacillus lacus TaxID=1348429 RepID=A0A292YC47_9BACL|nr:hypothetical protein [Effusibacillus lacus]TCS74312.1 hypothetical protein EDD64_11452 [Effusibacillus lacus]GAX88772.1 hypothetical protein EFBL_0386 [Effusibacillus lacus]